MNDASFERDILDAHAAGDGREIARLYAEAAARAERSEDMDRAGFFLTQAWIFALEAGDPLAEELRARLVAQGRETET